MVLQLKSKSVRLEHDPSTSRLSSLSHLLQSSSIRETQFWSPLRSARSVHPFNLTDVKRAQDSSARRSVRLLQYRTSNEVRAAQDLRLLRSVRIIQPSRLTDVNRAQDSSAPRSVSVSALFKSNDVNAVHERSGLRSVRASQCCKRSDVSVAQESSTLIFVRRIIGLTSRSSSEDDDLSDSDDSPNDSMSDESMFDQSDDPMSEKAGSLERVKERVKEASPPKSKDVKEAAQALSASRCVSGQAPKVSEDKREHDMRAAEPVILSARLKSREVKLPHELSALMSI
mmetsp:Transcript_2865/g.9767  ORF Transcript_2865/g.9767 Transcript_2865/m.9767 type:complete len:285 (-) Transcript_2865:92-946(-)